jgi:hypothetical protein
LNTRKNKNRNGNNKAPKNPAAVAASNSPDTDFSHVSQVKHMTSKPYQTPANTSKPAHRNPESYLAHLKRGAISGIVIGLVLFVADIILKNQNIATHNMSESFSNTTRSFLRNYL